MTNQLGYLSMVVVVGACAHAAPGGVAASLGTPRCSEEQEAARWMRDLKPDFTGADSADLGFRSQLGLQRVDSAAVIQAVTDPQVCSDVYDVVGPRLSRLSFPFRLAIVRIGPYYAVAVVDATPLNGIVYGGRTLVWILDASTLQVLHDNILM